MVDSTVLAICLQDNDFCQRYGCDTSTIACLFVPNTYEVYWNTSIDNLMERMQKEHKHFWNDERTKKASAIGLTPNYPENREMAKKGYFTVDKGSVTVNGVSLTVCNPTSNTFQVAIIPYTFEHTNFCDIKVGTVVNLEFDILGKYIARLQQL